MRMQLQKPDRLFELAARGYEQFEPCPVIIAVVVSPEHPSLTSVRPGRSL